MNRQTGFTLAEVMVAMAILSTAVAAALVLMSGQLAAAGDVERRMLAGIVAENLLVEVMANNNTPQLRTETGVEALGGVDWQWTRVTAETPVNGMVRITIDIRQEDSEQVIRTLSAFRAVGQ